MQNLSRQDVEDIKLKSFEFMTEMGVKKHIVVDTTLELKDKENVSSAIKKPFPLIA